MQAAPPREERKVITALFCDLVGSTAQGERLDPEDLQALLSRYHSRVRAELERFGGTVEKFIGDAVVALFGAPLAHEDDPERAVRAALAVREWVLEQPDLHVRMAVNTGEALVVLGARAAHGEHLASGDVLNTAARLQAAAPVDGILVGEHTYRATERVIEYREPEPVAAKGKSEPVRVWEVVQARSRFGVDVEQAPRTELIGRERELRLLKEAFERAREEGEPQLVTLVGVPGIGKSRLVYELSRVVDADPELVIWRQGRCLPYGDGVSFWALGEIVKAHAGVLESDPREQVQRKLREAASDARLESHLRPLVGLSAPQLTGADLRTEAFAAWRQFFEQIAEERPLVLVVEDLHWADDNLLDFVDYLVDWASAVPILIICTARPELLERRPAWGGGKSNALTISLAPLADDDAARLVGELLGQSAVKAEVEHELLMRAAGNPLYAEQYVRLLHERGELYELPETVHGIVAARLDLLNPRHKALLQDAAVLGKTFWTGGLQAVSGLDQPILEERLHALVRTDFVRRERQSSVAEETQYSFLHVLVRDVAYGQLPRAERAERHRRAAEWISSLGRRKDHAEMLAYHHLQALEFARAAGLDTSALVGPARLALRDAGDRAAALYAVEAAERFYDEALRLWPKEDPGRIDLLYRRALPVGLHLGGGDPDRLTEARDALLAAGDTDRAAEVEISLAQAFWIENRPERAEQHRARALALLGEGPPTRARAWVLSRLSLRAFLTGETHRASTLAREAYEVAGQTGAAEIRAESLSLVGVMRHYAGDPRGIEDQERSVELATSSGAFGTVVRVLNNLAVTHQELGNLEAGYRVRLQAAEAAERLGSESSVRWGQAVLLDHRYRRGDWDEARRDADDFLAKAETGSSHVLTWQVSSIRAELRLAKEDVGGALDDADRALATGRAVDEIQAITFVLAGCAHIFAVAGQRERATAAADELLEMLRAGINMQFAVINLPAFASFALRHGLGDRLQDTLAHYPESRWTEAVGAYLAGDFAAAADLLAEAGARSDEAEARLRAGDAVNVRRALEFYRSVDATRYIREAESQLAAHA